MESINQNKAASVNQIVHERNNVPTTFNKLTGYIGNSMNGGHYRTIHFKKIMAGEKHAAMRLRMNIQMLAPKTPTYQNLKMTVQAFYVPNSRVWNNAEKYTAQLGGSTTDKIAEIPNLATKSYGIIPDYATGEYCTPVYNTTLWRDSITSCYIPRPGVFQEYPNPQEQGAEDFVYTLPKMTALPLRGFKAIWNDYLRNKEYDEEITEYKGDTVGIQEIQTYMPHIQGLYSYKTARAKRPDSYYTNYRTELQGFDSDYPPSEMNAEEALINWMAWEQKFAEAKTQAENVQKNPWAVIAEMRGSRILTEGKVQKIGEKTFDLNYAAVTQNTYNTNEQIEEEFRVLGKQGAYSYTEVDLALYNGIEFVEEGYVHIIANVWADTVFENAIDRNLLNITPLSEYRPDLINDTKDVIYEVEMGTSFQSQQEWEDRETSIYGFKRKYSELFKLGNVIAGDMCSQDYYDVPREWNEQNKRYTTNVIEYDSNKPVITNSTYQFFERNVNLYEEYGSNGKEFYEKKHWKDYTDLMIGKNQAIKPELAQIQDDIKVLGQNQIFFVGAVTVMAELPVSKEIANNYTSWGDHK